MTPAKKKTEFSDTVTVTRDGRTKVDTSRLFNKPHIQKMLREMRRDIVVRPKRQDCAAL